MNVALISLYNPQHLGVLSLQRYLCAQGVRCSFINLKSFSSLGSAPITEQDLNQLAQLIQELDPGLIGLSVMTSVQLDAAIDVSFYLRQAFPMIPIVWGGVYPTLFPESALSHCRYAIRGAGETSLLALARGGHLNQVPGLSYRRSTEIAHNPVIQRDIGTYEAPPVETDRYMIDSDDRLTTYETSASRGCAFSCSYCCSAELRRRGGAPSVQLRSVEAVISELSWAKNRWPLQRVRFWDSVFPSQLDWVQDFAARYKEKIDLPFGVWSHPLVIQDAAIAPLVKAGLESVVVGIQSGSETLRRNTLNRQETNEQILAADDCLNRVQVPSVVYDLMMFHPFETSDDRAQTAELCSQLKQPCSFQVHGLLVFPGTAIEELAKQAGYDPGQGYGSYWGPNKGAVTCSLDELLKTLTEPDSSR